MDKRRFEQLWSRCAKNGSRSVAGECFEEVMRHYTEPHRRYHTPEHVAHCLEQFDDARAGMDYPDTVELAIWYHDVIYNNGARDNELQSARLFERRARPVMPASVVERVHGLIMVTVHPHACPQTGDQGYMIDIDLSSFGLPWPRFQRDSIAVREEFPHMSDEEFYTKQCEFLSKLLERDYFCYTEFFRARHEARARENITRYLEELAASGLI